jgi:hypothetical protein
MVIIPRDKAVLENLNIYYLNVKKLLEHYQGEIGSGGVYFKSHAAEGAIFFDKDDLLNGHFRDKTIELTGREAIERLVGAGDKYNFNVTIYKIAAKEVYFWASIPSAEKICHRPGQGSRSHIYYQRDDYGWLLFMEQWQAYTK